MNSLVLREKIEETKGKKKKGFTLIELIIVIAIIAILAALAIPKFAEIRENANVKADIASAKAIQSAVAVAVTNGQSGFDLNSTVSETNLKSVLNGGVIPKPKASEAKAGSFSAAIDNKGNVTVTANSLQVLPNPDAPYKVD